MSLRDLPPVEPIEPPARYSQTIVRHFDRCNRSAYLYRKHRGGVPSHDLERGTAFHTFAERALNLMVENDEPKIPPDVAKDLMMEVLRESNVPVSEWDRLRIASYHFAEGYAIDPARVVGIERKFVIPVGDREVSCKLDFCALSEDGSEAWVEDFKTTYRLAAMDELATKLPDGRHAAKAAQLLIYVLALAYGFPVRDVPCPTCEGKQTYLVPSGSDLPDVRAAGPGEVIEVNGDPGGVVPVRCHTCDGRGTIEEREPYRIGERVQVFNCAELYPSYLFDDGIGRRDVTVTRAELPDHMDWLESVVARMDEAFESWKFPAVPGSHCSECPAARECPLPVHLRDHRGEIDSPEKAAEAAERRMFLQAESKAIWGSFGTTRTITPRCGSAPIRCWCSRTRPRRSGSPASASGAPTLRRRGRRCSRQSSGPSSSESRSTTRTSGGPAPPRS